MTWANPNLTFVVRLPRLGPVLDDEAGAGAGISPRLIARFSFNSSLRCFVEIGFLRGIVGPWVIGVDGVQVLLRFALFVGIGIK